jgi:hypothetical protein
MTTLGSMASGRYGAVSRAVPRPSPGPSIERYSSVTWVTRVHTVTLSKLIIVIFISISIHVNKHKVRPKTSCKLLLTLSLKLFVSTKVQLADIWFSLAVCQWRICALELLRRISPGRAVLNFFSENPDRKNCNRNKLYAKTCFYQVLFSIAFFFPMWTCRFKILLYNFTNGTVHASRGYTVPLAMQDTHYNMFIFVSIPVNMHSATVESYLSSCNVERTMKVL